MPIRKCKDLDDEEITKCLLIENDLANARSELLRFRKYHVTHPIGMEVREHCADRIKAIKERLVAEGYYYEADLTDLEGDGHE